MAADARDKRTIAIGDVHGCIDELRELVALVDYRAGVDRLVFVGDLIDRGPEPAAVVRYVRELAGVGDVLAILGNHEEKMLRWFRRVDDERAGGMKNKMSPPDADRLAQWEALSVEDRSWLGALPIVIEPLAGWLAVHGGFDGAYRPDARKKEKLLRCRWVDAETGRMRSMTKDFGAPENSVFWAERWVGPQHVVYGHAVHSKEAPRVDRKDGIECWGIDTGCCFGGKLTAFVLESREVAQVNARAKYSELGGEDVE
jgi:bis(5'-nucleosyl)-tetraphosphatase (symmetrical)